MSKISIFLGIVLLMNGGSNINSSQSQTAKIRYATTGWPKGQPTKEGLSSIPVGRGLPRQRIKREHLGKALS